MPTPFHIPSLKNTGIYFVSCRILLQLWFMYSMHLFSWVSDGVNVSINWVVYKYLSLFNF